MSNKSLREMINELSGGTSPETDNTNAAKVDPTSVVYDALTKAKMQAAALNISESDFMAAIAKFFADQGYEITTRPAEVLKTAEEASTAIENAVEGVYDKANDLNDTFEELEEKARRIDRKLDKILLFSESVEDGMDEGREFEDMIRSLSEKVDFLEIDRDELKSVIREAVEESLNKVEMDGRRLKRVIREAVEESLSDVEIDGKGLKDVVKDAVEESLSNVEIDGEGLKDAVKDAVEETDIELDAAELFNTKAFKQAIRRALEELGVEMITQSDAFETEEVAAGPSTSDEIPLEEVPGEETDFVPFEAPEPEITETEEEEEGEEDHDEEDEDEDEEIKKESRRKGKKGKVTLKESKRVGSDELLEILGTSKPFRTTRK